jgi:NAD(P)-dependent dehydrogenase (short-subunit alcohol dehydrogenase family)
MNLKDKIIVITGSTRGLGRALACGFLKEQAKVVINTKSKKELREAAEEIGAVGFCADVIKEKDVQKLADFAVKKFGRIDIWINNAGISIGHMSIEEVDAKEAHRLMEVNFFGTFFGCRSAMKYMKQQKEGTLVNIISCRAMVPSPMSSVYSASKWAVRGLTELLRPILEPENISVIGVYPGSIKTCFWGECKPTGYDNYMETSYVVEKIINNLKLDKPTEELMIEKE